MKLQHATNVDFSACEIEVFKQLLLAIKSEPKCRITLKKNRLIQYGKDSICAKFGVFPVVYVSAALF